MVFVFTGNMKLVIALAIGAVIANIVSMILSMVESAKKIKKRKIINGVFGEGY